MEITVCFFEGCPNAEPTLALVRRTLAEMAIEVPVRGVLVEDAEAASCRGFLGSPTVQIDGLDIERERREDAPFFGCRLYRSARGMSGTPPAEMVRSAIVEALRARAGGTLRP